MNSALFMCNFFSECQFLLYLVTTLIAAQNYYITAAIPVWINEGFVTDVNKITTAGPIYLGLMGHITFLLF